MLEIVGGTDFETSIVCPGQARPDFLDGFGKRMKSIDNRLDFNAWFTLHREELRALVAQWGVLVVEDVVVKNNGKWGPMTLDPEYLYHPWHSDGYGGTEMILLTQMRDGTPRNVPTLVAPSAQIQQAIKDEFLAREQSLSAMTRDVLQRSLTLPVSSLAFFLTVDQHLIHAHRSEMIALKQFLEAANDRASEWIYKHHSRANSVLIMDTKHHGASKRDFGFNKVVHARMPLVCEKVVGVYPWRLAA